MSTFSGLSTALSSLTTQRQALEIAGQNIANVNTVGYTRQRLDTASVGAGQGATLFSQGSLIGNGVQATGVSRLGDLFMDARVRTTTSSASYLAARTDAYKRLESTIAEPGDNGISKQLDDFWATWQDMVASPGSAAVGQVLLEGANSVQRSIATGYSAVVTQWDQTRSKADMLVSDINSAASAVAELNEKIRSISVSGGNANELIDQRNLLTTSLSALAGTTVRNREDGTVDVNLAGNPLVSGVTANKIKLVGSTEMLGATGTDADPVRVEWDRVPAGTPAALEGGELAGALSVLAPYNDQGTGGLLAQAAQSYNALADKLRDTVNAIHNIPVASGGTGVDFFSIDAGSPAALGLRVAITDTTQIVTGDPAKGAKDSSIADKISQIGESKDSPDTVWSTFVVATGVKAKAALQSATVSEAARMTAESLQLSQTAVDQDEESINLLSFQRAYQGAARVMTTIDEMLDQLINRTGVVGR
ncbi:flagellar hook-associated protein 1 FlgK [Sanguibacter gelidistatuariae]|uniref:Flagellar hook-associated protein 1 n=1 Tax=Sanguibacter gelidistatuariae TaxID=1814289 RepID=A0A1G6PWS7_9MICO|nr:flagellar hook-associated protein FlgK [Sanguibacter gelidistatuariae]SDC83976.1 flagellar hook-associated protein 1 FlgK [Sanguibacter gelidistatuariae]